MSLEEIRRWIRFRDRFCVPPEMQVVRTVIEGQPIFFSIANPGDRIQRKQMRGRFYEPEELDLIRQHFPPGGVFCDIGANTGNHSIFAVRFCGASLVIPLEPNPAAYRLLVSNFILNDLLEKANLSALGFGISNRSQRGFGLSARENNLGATQLVEGSGEIELRAGDDLFTDRALDFLKIDVEGMELDVLEGFAANIARSRPKIFLELARTNEDRFARWLEQNDYTPLVEGRAFRFNRNVLIGPRRP